MAISIPHSTTHTGFVKSETILVVSVDMPNSELSSIWVGRSMNWTRDDARKVAESIMVFGVWHYDMLIAPRFVKWIEMVTNAVEKRVDTRG